MDVIYTDKALIDQGVLVDIDLDIDLADGRDFEIKASQEDRALSIGCYWYIDGTEYGGRVDKLKVDTDAHELTWSGRSWRGMLYTKIVEPPAGKSHRVLTGPWAEVVQALIDDCGLGGLFAADSSTLTLDEWQVDRYATLLDTLVKIAEGKRHRLRLTWSGGMVRVGSEPIRDLTESIQYETDDRVGLVVEDNQGGVNHLICLGKGEGVARTVVHLYCTATGSITELQQTFTGLDEITEIYENSSVEDREKLKESGFDKLKELRNSKTFSVTVQDYDVQIGDIVGGKESITGVTVAEPVKNIIFKLSGGVPSIEYKVGENT